MGTPAVMAVQVQDTVKWSYVNYDGYVSDTGRKLVEFYNDVESADALISLGDLSILDKSIECPEGHSFGTPIRGYTIAYTRDRGETGCDPRIGNYSDFLHMNKNIIRYLFKDGMWYIVRLEYEYKGMDLKQRYKLLPVGEVLAGLHD
ncbi:hypothetical protein pEaSNUABM44_00004 [Erwinia phage pEa_SNUABM_44]|nr:hypothetical protein pEaSNUABM44_00004 [Erwinia phage pEa_SNUABM_44]